MVLMMQATLGGGEFFNERARCAALPHPVRGDGRQIELVGKVDHVERPEVHVTHGVVPSGLAQQLSRPHMGL